ncbi:MAG: hypothetical protein KGL48_13475 [Sphingomonadales bacterium]|nr:hypothetical protein [Sphingomonadales bacterium]MDE2570206.1 hypothetical protein [Sphingomonadales bacterium]
MNRRDPWALPAAFFSIIVKRAAVVRSYPGGVERFERLYLPRKNGALFLVTRMSTGDVEFVLEELNEVDVVPGQDLAVADMVHGPLLQCPGLTFACEEDEFAPRWSVNVSREPRATPDAHLPRLPGGLHARPAREPSQAPEASRRTIVLDYGYDQHSIEVDSETFTKVAAGEPVTIEGQGFVHEEDGLLADRWYFQLAELAAGFILSNDAEFHGQRVWLEDGEGEELRG